MMTTIVILVVVFVVSALLMISNGIVSYQSTSCPQYVNTTKWLTWISVIAIITITVLGIVTINRTPDVKHFESATEYVEETVEVVDSCSTEIEMVDAPIDVKPVKEVEVQYVTETASVPMRY